MKVFDINKNQISELSNIPDVKFEVLMMLKQIEQYVINVTFIKKIKENNMDFKDYKYYCRKYEKNNNYEALVYTYTKLVHHYSVIKPNLQKAINHGKLLFSIYEEESYRITISEKYSKYKTYNNTFRIFLILKTI